MKPLPTLMVAPNGARKTKADHPALPITIDEVVETAIACHEAGADGLHLHVRDENGGHSLDAKLYQTALSILKTAVPELVVQITTEAVGLYSPVQQREVVEQVQPEHVSVSLKEMFSDGDQASAVAFYNRCRDHGVQVQHILYGAEDLKLLKALLDQKEIAQEELQLLFVLGRYTAGQQSTVSDLDLFTDWLKLNEVVADWAVCAFGYNETACLEAALKAGGRARVGFENSFFNVDGSTAASNAERVSEIAQIVKALS